MVRIALDAFVEIAVLEAAGYPGDPRKTFFERASELRELFKFEFYFPRRAEYRSEIERRPTDRFASWEEVIRKGETAVGELLDEVQLIVAHGLLRSFVHAYRVVAAVLESAGAAAMDVAS